MTLQLPFGTYLNFTRRAIFLCFLVLFFAPLSEAKFQCYGFLSQQGGGLRISSPRAASWELVGLFKDRSLTADQLRRGILPLLKEESSRPRLIKLVEKVLGDHSAEQWRLIRENHPESILHNEPSRDNPIFYIGAGPHTLAAALGAIRHGVPPEKIVILEKEGFVGGPFWKALFLMNSMTVERFDSNYIPNGTFQLRDISLDQRAPFAADNGLIYALNYLDLIRRGVRVVTNAMYESSTSEFIGDRVWPTVRFSDRVRGGGAYNTYTNGVAMGRGSGVLNLDGLSSESQMFVRQQIFHGESYAKRNLRNGIYEQESFLRELFEVQQSGEKQLLETLKSKSIVIIGGGHGMLVSLEGALGAVQGYSNGIQFDGKLFGRVTVLGADLSSPEGLQRAIFPKRNAHQLVSRQTFEDRYQSFDLLGQIQSDSMINTSRLRVDHISARGDKYYVGFDSYYSSADIVVIATGYKPINFEKTPQFLSAEQSVIARGYLYKTESKRGIPSGIFHLGLEQGPTSGPLVDRSRTRVPISLEALLPASASVGELQAGLYLDTLSYQINAQNTVTIQGHNGNVWYVKRP